MQPVGGSGASSLVFSHESEPQVSSVELVNSPSNDVYPDIIGFPLAEVDPTCLVAAPEGDGNGLYFDNLGAFELLSSDSLALCSMTYDET